MRNEFAERTTRQAKQEKFSRTARGFNEVNIFTKMFDKPQHEAYSLGKKKDLVIDIIEHNFYHMPSRVQKYEEKTINRDLLNKLSKDNLTQEQRKTSKKQKEQETKLYQDQQIDERK